MKPFLLFCFFTITWRVTYSQRADNFYLDVYDNSGKRINADANRTINGTPILHDGWGIGSVVLNNREQHNNIPLEFNIETNTLYFKKDSTPYTFSDHVNSFEIRYSDSSKIATVHFRSGFPDARGYPTNTLYQVMADGSNVTYLKYLRTHIEQHAEYGFEPKQVYVMSEELWIYNAKEKRMTKINRNKNSVTKGLAGYEVATGQYLDSSHARLDSDKQICALVTALNQTNAQ